jgi:hypothetical protein
VNRNQQIILWLGLVLTLVYLFTDKSFHAALTTTSSKPGTVQDADFTTGAQANPGTVTL